MTLSIPSTHEDLYKKIFYTLGGKNLAVHLYDVEVEMMLMDALILISARRPVYKTGTLELSPGIEEYYLESDCINIAAMYTGPTQNIVGAGSSPANVWRRTTKNFLMGTNLDNYINYYQSSSVVRFLAYINDQASILGMDTTWRRIGNKIQIQPTPLISTTFLYEYNYVRDFEEMTPFEKVWIYKYVLGQCKMVVGEKRRKFGGDIPLGLGNFKLNGDTLYSEGQALVEKQLEELKGIQAPLYPIFGR